MGAPSLTLSKAEGSISDLAEVSNTATCSRCRAKRLRLQVLATNTHVRLTPEELPEFLRRGKRQPCANSCRERLQQHP